MSNEQDPKNIENEAKEKPRATDELAGEDLDQVVGGAGPSLPPVSPTLNFSLKIDDKTSPKIY